MVFQCLSSGTETAIPIGFQKRKYFTEMYFTSMYLLCILSESVKLCIGRIFEFFHYKSTSPINTRFRFEFEFAYSDVLFQKLRSIFNEDFLRLLPESIYVFVLISNLFFLTL